MILRIRCILCFYCRDVALALRLGALQCDISAPIMQKHTCHLQPPHQYGLLRQQVVEGRQGDVIVRGGQGCRCCLLTSKGQPRFVDGFFSSMCEKRRVRTSFAYFWLTINVASRTQCCSVRELCIQPRAPRTCLTIRCE